MRPIGIGCRSRPRNTLREHCHDQTNRSRFRHGKKGEAGRNNNIGAPCDEEKQFLNARREEKDCPNARHGEQQFLDAWLDRRGNETHYNQGSQSISKLFFSEEKNQKTFMSLAYVAA